MMGWAILAVCAVGSAFGGAMILHGDSTRGDRLAGLVVWGVSFAVAQAIVYATRGA